MKKIKCSQIEELLSIKKNDEFSSEEQSLIEKHLKVCNSCFKFSQMLNKIEQIEIEEQLEPEQFVYENLVNNLKLRERNVKRKFEFLPDLIADLLNYRVTVYQVAAGFLLLLFAINLPNLIETEPALHEQKLIRNQQIQINQFNLTDKLEQLRNVGNNVKEDSLFFKGFSLKADHI